MSPMECPRWGSRWDSRWDVETPIKI